MSDQGTFAEEAGRNCKRIENNIFELQSMETNSSEGFHKFLDKSKVILEMFKDKSPLFRDDRERLWNLFQSVSNEFRRKQEQYKRDKVNVSARKKEIVMSTINEARLYAGGDIKDLAHAEELLKTANERMKDGWQEGFGTLDSLFHFSDGKMLKQDSEQCWESWKEVKQKIFYRRKDLYTSNHAIIKGELSTAWEMAEYGDPYEAMKSLKSIKGKIYSHPMSKENRNDIFDSLNSAMKKAFERIQEKKAEKERKQKEWEHRKQEKEQKKKEWEARQLEKERKRKEWEERNIERERKKREYEDRKIERERKQREWEERQRERERQKREYEERKLERQREYERRREERESRRSSERGRGRNHGGGCYITTAVCQSLGKPDNCSELNTIRRFRDTWLIFQKDGPELIKNYYTEAPFIVNINLKPNAASIYQGIWSMYLEPFFKLISIDSNNKAKDLYLLMVSNLKSEFYK